MIKELIKLANHLDSKGLRKEADKLDSIIKSAISSSSLDTDDYMGGIPSLMQPDFASPGYDPDTGKVSDLSDEDIEDDQERNKAWEELQNFAKENNMTMDDILRVIDMNTNLTVKDETNKIRNFLESKND